MFKKLDFLIPELIKLATISISLYIILRITMVKILFFALADSTTLNQAMLSLPDTRFNILIALVLLSVGWVISYQQRQLHLANPFKFDPEELISYAIMAVFFSYYFSKSFAFFGTFGIFSILILGTFFFLLIPQLVTYCSSYGYRNLIQVRKYLIATVTRENIISFSKNLLVVSLVLLLGAYSLSITAWSFKKTHDYEAVLSSNLFITSISPKKTTYAYKVTLQGYHFGGTTDKRYKLFTKHGQVTTSLWTDNKIEFVIPLHWKEGSLDLWIERPNRFDDKRTEVSNAVQLELLNRWEFFPTVDDPIQTRIGKRLLRILYLEYWNNLVYVFPF